MLLVQALAPTGLAISTVPAAEPAVRARLLLGPDLYRKFEAALRAPAGKPETWSIRGGKLPVNLIAHLYHLGFLAKPVTI